jgi:alpha-tubulin suppressor-like RCC1 family protein
MTYFEEAMGTLPTGATVKMAACGATHLMVIVNYISDTSGGTLYAIGDNTYGQLGLGNNDSKREFTKVTDGVLNVACGAYHTLAIFSSRNGSTNVSFSCGHNTYGQLGQLNNTHSNTFNECLVNLSTSSPNVYVSASYTKGIACGDYHSAIILDDGSQLFTAGRNHKGQLGLNSTSDVNGFKCCYSSEDGGAGMVACGANTTYWTYNNPSYNGGSVYKTLFGCGDNTYGQMGTDPITGYITNNTPISIKDASGASVKVIKISCGANHCAVTAENTYDIYIWGSNGNGQLANGSTTDYYVPSNIDRINNIECISSQYAYTVNNTSFIATDTSNVYYCGDSGNGQSGYGVTFRNFRGYFEIIPNSSMSFVNSCSSLITYCICDNKLYSCGITTLTRTFDNVYKSKIGVGPLYMNSSYSSGFPDGGNKIKKIAYGNNFMVVLLSDGTIYGCGDNTYNQLRNDDGMDNIASLETFVKLMFTDTSLNTVKNIACGDGHIVVIGSDDNAYGCGRNTEGQLGTGNTTNQSAFYKMTDTIDVAQIACGRYHTLLLRNGVIYSTGYNNYGQLGRDSGTSSATGLYTLYAVNAFTHSTITKMACGAYHSFCIDSDGKAYCCGHNGQGQLGIGNTTSVKYFTDSSYISGIHISNISCGDLHTVAKRSSDGLVFSCGYNGYGQLGRNTSPNTFDYYWNTVTLSNGDSFYSNQILCASNHTYLESSDNHLYSCGYDEYGQLGFNYSTDASYNGITGSYASQTYPQITWQFTNGTTSAFKYPLLMYTDTSLSFTTTNLAITSSNSTNTYITTYISSNSDAAYNYNITSVNTTDTIITIDSSGLIKPVNVGTATVAVYQNENDYYTYGYSSNTMTVTVESGAAPAKSNLSVKPNIYYTYNKSSNNDLLNTYILLDNSGLYTTSSTGNMTFSLSGNSSYASITGTSLLLKIPNTKEDNTSITTLTINVSQSDTSYYYGGSGTSNLIIYKENGSSTLSVSQNNIPAYIGDTSNNYITATKSQYNTSSIYYYPTLYTDASYNTSVAYFYDSSGYSLDDTITNKSVETTTLYVKTNENDYYTSGYASTSYTVSSVSLISPNLKIITTPLSKSLATTTYKYSGNVDTSSNGTLTYSVNFNGASAYFTINSSTGDIYHLSTGTGASITVSQAATSVYTSGSATGTYNVTNDTTQTSTVLKVPSTINTQVYSPTTTTYNFYADVSSNSTVAYVFSSSNTAVANINSSTGVITNGKAGTATITTYQASSSLYTEASGTTTYEIAKKETNILVEEIITTYTYSPSSQQFDYKQYYETNNTEYIPTYYSSNTSIATIDTSGIVSILKAGTCNITVSQIGSSSGNYTDGSGVSTLTIQQANTDISIVQNLSETYSLNKQLDYRSECSSTNHEDTPTYTSSNTLVATIDTSGIITIKGVGTTTIKVEQGQGTSGAKGNYAYGYGETTLTITQANTVIYVTDELPSYTYSTTLQQFDYDNYYDTNNTEDTPIYSSSNTSVATIDTSGIVSIIGAGSCDITVSQSGKNYTDSSGTSSLTVNKATPNLIRPSELTVNGTYDTSYNFALDVSSNSTGAITYAYVKKNSGDSVYATVSTAGLVTHISAGEFYINISQASTSNYDSISSQTLYKLIYDAVSKTTAYISADTEEHYTGDYGSIYNFKTNAQVYTNNADTPIVYESSNANLPIDQNGVITNNSNANATTTITMYQPETTNYYGDSTTSTYFFTIASSVKQTNNMEMPNTYNHTSYQYDTFDFKSNCIIPSSSTGTYTYDSSDTSVATISSSGIITNLKTGQTTITVTQAETDTYLSATDTTVYNLTIEKLTSDMKAPSSLTHYDVLVDSSFNYASEVISSSTGAYTYSIENNGVATINSSGIVTNKNSGTTTITVSQAETDVYKSATEYTSYTITILNDGKQSSNLKVQSIINHTDYVNSTYDYTQHVDSSSNGAYTYLSDNTEVATIDSSGIITNLKTGTAKITVSQAETTEYTDSSGYTIYNLTANKKTPIISYPESITETYATNGTYDFSDDIIFDDPSAGTLTYSSNDTSVLEIGQNGVIQYNGIGTAIITSIVKETNEYSSLTVYTTFTLTEESATKYEAILSVPTSLYSYMGVSTVNYYEYVSSNSNGSYTYTTDNSSIATISSSGVVTNKSVGTCTITVKQAETSIYTSATAQTTYTVYSSDPNNGKYQTILSAPYAIDEIYSTYTYSYGELVKSYDNNSNGNNPNPITYSSSNTNVATINASSGNITMIGTGQDNATSGFTYITSSQAGDSSYTSTTASTTFTVYLAPSDLTADEEIYIYGDVSYNSTLYYANYYTSSSNASYIYTSNDTSVAEIDEFGKITINGVGETILSVQQLQNQQYYGSTQYSTLFSYTHANTLTAPSTATFYADNTVYNYGLDTTSNSSAPKQYTSHDTTIAYFSDTVNGIVSRTVSNKGGVLTISVSIRIYNINSQSTH